MDPKAMAALERIEHVLADAERQTDDYMRISEADSCAETLTALAKWAEKNAPGTRFLARVYRALGTFHAIHKRTRQANETWLAAHDLGCEYDAEALFNLGKYFVADRCDTRAALKLYSKFAREFPFRADELSTEDRSRIHEFLYEQAANVDGPEPELRRALALACAEAFPNRAPAHFASALWMIRAKNWAGAHDALNRSWDRVSAEGTPDRRLAARVAEQLAIVCRNLERPEEALEYLSHSLDFDPLQIDGYLISAELTLKTAGGVAGSDTILSSRLRARLSKALRWLDRASENARRAGAEGQFRERIARLRGELERAGTQFEERGA